MRKRSTLFYHLMVGFLAAGLAGCLPATPAAPTALPEVTQAQPLPASTSTPGEAAAPTATPAASAPSPATPSGPYATVTVANLPAANPTPEPTVAVAPGAFPLVNAYQFVDAQTVLAPVGPEHDQNFTPLPGTFHLLRSTDGAATWKEITPSGVVSGSLTGIVDANTFWVVEHPGDPNTQKDILYRTTDGGQTWQKIDAPWSMGSLDMVDAQNGWATASPGGCGAGTCWVDLYFTTDGGQTWTAYQPQPPLHTESALSANTIAMSSGSDIRFPALDTIWFGGGYIDYGMPDLLVSRDRGQTWQSIQILLPQGLSLQQMSLPTFLDQNNGFLTITVVPGETTGVATEQRMTAIYVTTDGGRTWTLRPLVEFGDFTSSIQFVTAADWFTTCRGALCRTHDGGQTWQALPLPSAPGATYITIARFFSAQNGYALASFATTDGRESQQIFATHDGGQTWNKVEPVMQ